VPTKRSVTKLLGGSPCHYHGQRRVLRAYGKGAGSRLLQTVRFFTSDCKRGDWVKVPCEVKKDLWTNCRYPSALGVGWKDGRKKYREQRGQQIPERKKSLSYLAAQRDKNNKKEEKIYGDPAATTSRVSAWVREWAQPHAPDLSSEKSNHTPISRVSQEEGRLSRKEHGPRPHPLRA